MALKRIDLTGQTFGDWTVLGYAGKSKWECTCSCEDHTIKPIHSYDLRNGKSKSCGHNSTKFRDLTGKQFGSLTATRYLGNQRWECVCRCGAITEVSTYRITSGQTKSCGCRGYGIKIFDIG